MLLRVSKCCALRSRRMMATAVRSFSSMSPRPFKVRNVCMEAIKACDRRTMMRMTSAMETIISTSVKAWRFRMACVPLHRSLFKHLGNVFHHHQHAIGPVSCAGAIRPVGGLVNRAGTDIGLQLQGERVGPWDLRDADDAVEVAVRSLGG